ncbi:MAG TPA: PLP-dependent aminotransferase family protein, partial [Gemmatimonadaceae bacterium]|nr:PLP-dependent aminotransferase family protein [Gemmatimonadaceae bacterium]
DDDGLDVDAGRRAAPDARLAYAAPSHQFPLGVTMGLARRLALLEWARQRGAWVVEDDYDSEFRYAGRPLPALQGLDADRRVVYVGTFSKTLFPSLRLGYAVVPDDLVDAFARAHVLSDYLAPTLDQAVAADFLAGGHFARHVRRMRALYRERQAALLAALDERLRGAVRAGPAAAGMHLVAWLPPGADDRAASRAALDAGVEAPPLSIYCRERPRPSALLLGYAATPAEEIPRAVERLAAALEGAGALRG